MSYADFCFRAASQAGWAAFASVQGLTQTIDGTTIPAAGLAIDGPWVSAADTSSGALSFNVRLSSDDQRVSALDNLTGTADTINGVSALRIGDGTQAVWRLNTTDIKTRDRVWL